MMVVTAINIASVVAVLPYSYHMQVFVCSNPHSMPLVLKSVRSIRYNFWHKGKGGFHLRFSGFCPLRGYPPPYPLNGKSV